MSKYLQPDKPTQEISHKINDFFFIESNNDYAKAKEEVQKVGIVNLSFDPGNYGNNGTLTIYTNRPGILIGRKGTRIDALAEYLKPFNVEKINIEEAFDWTSALAPVDYQQKSEDELEAEAYNSFSNWLETESYMQSGYDRSRGKVVAVFRFDGRT
jgi:predicted RNA-binding protein Jag